MNKIEKKAKEYAHKMGFGDFNECEIQVFRTGYLMAIQDVVDWLKLNTNWDMEFDESGCNPYYGKIKELADDLIK